MFVRACGSWSCNVTAKVPTLPKAGSAAPTPSRTQAAGGGTVAVRPESEWMEGAKQIESSPVGEAGAEVRRAAEPGAVTVAATEFVWTKVPLIPVIVTV